jgi:hypothetical protein
MTCAGIPSFISRNTPECPPKLKSCLQGRTTAAAFVVIALVALAIGAGLTLAAGGGFSLYNLAALFLVASGTGGLVTTGFYSCRKKENPSTQHIEVTVSPQSNEPS